MSIRGLKPSLEILSRWRLIEDADKERVCLAIIDYFVRNLDDIDAIAALAEALAASGEIWSWPAALRPLCDVPSTGGPSSLTTLLCPYILAACGCFVPKVSVPGSMAGALDVLGLLKGFRTDLDRAAMLRALESSKIAHTANTSSLAPADAYLFQMRKKIGKKSVPSLAIASLLSKKIAVSCESSAVDIRCGTAGNMGSDYSTCERNAALFVEVAARLGIATSCVVTDISEPRIPFLGRSESLIALNTALSATNLHPWLSDHIEVCIAIAGEALRAAKLANNGPAAAELARTTLVTQRAQAAFYAHLEAQGTGINSVETLLESYRSSPRRLVISQHAGYIAHIEINRLKRILARVNQPFPERNDRLGLTCLKRQGMQVEAGEPLLEFRHDANVDVAAVEAAVADAARAFDIVDHPPEPLRPEIITVVRSSLTEDSDV